MLLCKCANTVLYKSAQSEFDEKLKTTRNVDIRKDKSNIDGAIGLNSIITLFKKWSKIGMTIPKNEKKYNQEKAYEYLKENYTYSNFQDFYPKKVLNYKHLLDI